MGKTKSKVKKKKRRLQQKAIENGTSKKKILGNDLKNMIIDESSNYEAYFSK